MEQRVRGDIIGCGDVVECKSGMAFELPWHQDGGVFEDGHPVPTV